MIITADGNHEVKTFGYKTIIKASGTFGGGSLTLGYKDQTGAVVAYGDNNTAKTAAGEWIIEHGGGVPQYIICTGATSPSIKITTETVR